MGCDTHKGTRGECEQQRHPRCVVESFAVRTRAHTLMGTEEYTGALLTLFVCAELRADSSMRCSQVR